jgi:thiol-disulfide isomerase/thioredoxin
MIKQEAMKPGNVLMMPFWLPNLPRFFRVSWFPAQTPSRRVEVAFAARTLFLLLVLAAGAASAATPERLPIEKQVAEIIASSKPTVVHFWAPWCPNCYAELKNKGWSNFIDANPDVNFVFVTTWSGDSGDGRAELVKRGIGAQKNFQLVMHPNTSRKDGEKMESFLGMPMLWLPATWVFRDGKLRYALNYGEVRFPILQQLVKDAAEKWE